MKIQRSAIVSIDLKTEKQLENWAVLPAVKQKGFWNRLFKDDRDEGVYANMHKPWGTTFGPYYVCSIEEANAHHSDIKTDKHWNGERGRVWQKPHLVIKLNTGNTVNYWADSIKDVDRALNVISTSKPESFLEIEPFKEIYTL